MSSSSGITATVAVDGTPIADTAAEYESGVPTALEGLAMTWGRDGPASQPDVGSCSLTIADRNGDTDFLGLLHVGHTLTVTAAAPVGAGAGEAVTDPGFATPPANRVAVSGPAGWKLSDDPAHAAPASPGHALRALVAGVSTLFVPPAPFTTLPGGWTLVPRAVGGGTWTMTVMVRTGPFPNPGMTWQVVGFPDSGVPDPANLVLFGSPAPFTPAVNGYVTAGGQVVMPATGPFPIWLGIAIAGAWSPAWNQIPGATTWATCPAGSWADAGSTWLDEHHATPPASATISANLFVGRITDMEASAMGPAAVSVAITCSEWTSDLANVNIGDNPWPAQTLAARAGRIATLAGQEPSARKARLIIDARPGAYQVSWVDVDRQPALGLLQDLAVTGDAVLWPIGENVLWYEDPDTRASASTLVQDPDSGYVVISSTRNNTAVLLSSCDVLRDPFTLAQTVEDVMTRVSVTWQEQTLDDKGAPAPTDRTLTVTDDVARAQYGERSLSVSTQLTTSADGTAMANRVLARSRAGAWHTTGAVWDTTLPREFDSTHLLGALQLLDMAARVGLLLTIADCPAWVPLGPDLSAYVEGGTYTYTAGRWVLELALAPSIYSGQSLGWVDVNAAWPWQSFDPGIAWWDLWGVGGSALSQLEAVSNASNA